jgi:hypothetical protein
LLARQNQQRNKMALTNGRLYDKNCRNIF